MRAAEMQAEKIGDSAGAAAGYEEVLTIEPGQAEASEALEALYRQRGDWAKLVDLLLGRIEFAEEPENRIDIFCSIAKVCEDEMQDEDRAFMALQEAFREDYGNDTVADELQRLATKANKWNELLTDYTRMAQEIASPKKKADLWVKIANWYDSALSHTEYAVNSALQALQVEPAHEGALLTLQRLYEKQGMTNELVWALQRHAEVTEDVPAKVKSLLALADVQENKMGDSGKATVAYQQALEADSSCLPAIDALEGSTDGHKPGTAWSMSFRRKPTRWTTRLWLSAWDSRWVSCGRTGWGTMPKPSRLTKRS